MQKWIKIVINSLNKINLSKLQVQYTYHKKLPFFTGFFTGLTLSCHLCKQEPDKLMEFALNPMKGLVPVALASDNIDHDKSKTKRLNFIADAVEVAAPAIVHIEVTAQHRNGMSRFGTALSSGSGFIVTAEGMILTNAHVVHNAEKVNVRLSDGETVQGLVIDVDEETDLAAVKIISNKKIYPHLHLASTSNVRAGEWVAALGSPLRLSNTVTAGIVSCLHRASGDLGLRKDNVYIQTDAPINVGNSGGPLINLDGEVIGINCITVQQASGISFAIPSDVASEFLEGARNKEKYIKDGLYPHRGHRNQFYIGISMLTLSPQILRELQQRDPQKFGRVTGGVLVARVNPGSPSERF